MLNDIIILLYKLILHMKILNYQVDEVYMKNFHRLSDFDFFYI